MLAIGGHEQRETSDQQGTSSEANDTAGEFIIERFVQELSSKRTVLLIPTASTKPDEAAKSYVDLFTDRGIEKVEVLDIQSRAQANSPEVLAVA
ncbi:MAG: cyanophycinase [Hymenobacter sp.]|nr:cyanophycinase [Hymenobacter sp.]